MEVHLEKMHPELLGSSITKPHVKAIVHTPKRKSVVVDGPNVAHFGQKIPSVRQLKLAYRTLHNKGYDPIIIVSMALRHNIDDEQDYLRLVNLGWLHEADSDRNDDEAIIETAIAKNCLIISNDRYLEYIDHYESKINLQKQIRRFVFRNNKFIVGK